jgi:formylglycine-generating enzyme required for sulfatase activity
MKKLIYIGLLCLTYLTTFAQEAEQIDLGPYGTLIVRTNKKPIEYYVSQINVWGKKVKQNKKDANAWLNYFAATKCAYQMEVTKLMENAKPGTGIDMSGSKFQYAKIADEAYKSIPNTFEGNYLMHNRDNYHIKLDYSYLLKANEIKPFDKRILWSLLVYYEAQQDLEKSKLVANEIAKTNLISSVDYSIAYNILSELEENAFFVSVGYEEYMACLILQKLKNIKPNAVISSNFISFPTFKNIYKYTEKTLERLQIPSSKNYSYDTINKQKIAILSEEEQLVPIQAILNTDRPVYFSIRNQLLMINKLGENLYLHGLTYRYSKQPANYIYNIKENYEKNYSLDYIKHDISPIPTDNYDQSLYYMYFPSALKLYQFYQEKGMYLEQQEMKKFIKQIAEKSGKDFNKILETIDKPIEYPFISEKIDFDKLQKSFVALNEVDHIGKFEVTNQEYNLFLKNLKQTKNYESYYKYYPDTTLWNKNFALAFHDPMTNMYNWHPAYRNYPVLNITYEAAVAYCEWLTEQYNQQNPDGKHVTFRLPTEQEWRYAAGSKNEKAITPFPNDQILTNDPKSLGIKTDASSCYLGNIKFERKSVEEPQIIPKKDTIQPTDKKGVVDGVFISGKGKYSYHDDGGFHTVTVSSYYPNALGLYNTFGNVAEMTSTKGVIKGGSWDDVFDDCTFDKNSTLAAPDSRVGFRIMMKVIPEIKHKTVVKIEKNVYCRKYEERIYDYERYLMNIIQLYGINSIEYKNAFPDSTLWKSENMEALKNKLNLYKLKDSIYVLYVKDTSMLTRTFEKTFVILDTLTKPQLDNYLKYKSDEEFKEYLIENEYIKNLNMHNNPPIFTKEAYYTGKLDSICLKEKFMYYPVISVPTEKQKQLANIYTQKQLEKGEYAPTNPNSIYSSFVNKTYYDLVKYKTKSFPNFYTIYELKKGVKLSDIKSFDLWENYRFVLTWKQWTPNQTK